MKIRIIEGKYSGKVRKQAYEYLKEKYIKVKKSKNKNNKGE